MPFTTNVGPLGKKKALHFLRRACFSYTKSDVDTFSNYTAQQAVDSLFVIKADPLPPKDPATGLTWVDQPAVSGAMNDGDLQKYFKAWWMSLMHPSVSDPDRLSKSAKEKLVFWMHTFFTVIQGTVGNSRYLYWQNALLRKYAFDQSLPAEMNFKKLTLKISLDNAMIALLDGQLNVKGNPNENYARELFELYSIGKGLPGFVPSTEVLGDYIYFTEQDVRAASRVLSGYDLDDKMTNIDLDTELPRVKVKSGTNGVVSSHDSDDKVFSDRLGNVVIKQNTALLFGGKPTEESMHDELSQLIDLIYNQSETHFHVCRRLYRYYMYHHIDSSIDQDLIADLTSTFVSSGFKIESVVRKILTSSQFFDSMDSVVKNDSFGAIIKSPLELAINTLSMFESNAPNETPDLLSHYDYFNKLDESFGKMGMYFMNPSDVAGYEAYYQYPIYNRAWINPVNLAQRYKFLNDIISNKEQGNLLGLDVFTFVKKHFDTEANLGVEPLLESIIQYFLPMTQIGGELTQERFNYFLERFSNLGMVDPQGANNFWLERWPSAENYQPYKMDTTGMLIDLFNAILQSPEYQLA